MTPFSPNLPPILLPKVTSTNTAFLRRLSNFAAPLDPSFRKIIIFHYCTPLSIIHSEKKFPVENLYNRTNSVPLCLTNCNLNNFFLVQFKQFPRVQFLGYREDEKVIFGRVQHESKYAEDRGLAKS